MFEQAFDNIDNVLRREAGCTTELDYTEQTSWLLFLKYLDGLEQDKATEAELAGKKYSFILDKPYRWESWAAPKDKDGKLDHNKAMTGDDLRDFVNAKLFPYLHGFKQKASGPNTIEYKIGEIFGEIKNKIHSGYNLRDIIESVDELRFRSQAEKHELSHLYEAKIKNMGNAGRNGGEYYTPRPLIRAMIQVVKPQIGERIYDGACGSAGFLCESFDNLRQANPKRTTADNKTLQERTFYGKEKKSLAYVIAIMNMILHGIEAPNIIHTNTLSENLADIQEKDRYDVVLANPPFGGSERKEVQQNFPIRTGETAFLFLQHFIKILKAGGRGAVVIKNTFLSNADNASMSVRKMLLESCNLHTVLDCPGGTFLGAGVKTVVLFFEKGAPTRKIWFYQLDPGRTLGKTNPLNDDDLADFVKLQSSFADSLKSWSVDIKDVDQTTFHLSVKNPNGDEEVKHLSPQEIVNEVVALDVQSAEMLQRVQLPKANGTAWEIKKLGDLFEITSSKRVFESDWKREGVPFYRAREIVKLAKHGFVDNELFISEEMFNRYSAKYGIPSPGDIMVTGVGTLGICYVVREGDRFYFKDGNIIWLKKKSEVNSRFVEYAFQSEFLRKQIDESIGATVGTFTIIKAKNTLIPVPPLKEQDRIVGLLDETFGSVATAKTNAERKLVALEALKKSLLHDVLTGQLKNPS
jgi:type I restriction enzyme M protein